MTGDAEREGRRDELAWAAVHRRVETSAWHRVDRAVAGVLAEARERGLLDKPWTVYLFPDDAGVGRRPYVSIDPSGQWELAEEGGGGDVGSHASSERPGIYTTSNALALRVSYVLDHVFDG
jgi:hypothetical protein